MSIKQKLKDIQQFNFEDIIHNTDANEGTTSKETDCKVQEKGYKKKSCKALPSMNSHPLYVSYMQNKNWIDRLILNEKRLVLDRKATSLLRYSITTTHLGTQSLFFLSVEKEILFLFFFFCQRFLRTPTKKNPWTSKHINKYLTGIYEKLTTFSKGAIASLFIWA